MMMEGPRRAAEAENRILRRVMMKEGWAWLYVGLPVVVAETFHSKSAEIPSYYNADLGTMISIDEENERVEIELVVNTRERLENGGWRTVQERTIHVVMFKELALRWMVAFAMTIHRVQGKTINEPYMIFEAETMPINVLNTGLTRTTKSEYVLIPDTDLRKEVETRKKAISETNERTFLQHVNQRIAGYKKQDKDNGINVSNDAEYVDASFLWKKWRECDGTCDGCGQLMTIVNRHETKEGLWEWDRIDNSVGHLKSNGRMRCHQCNSSHRGV
jgi:hypothetical protein